MIGRDNAPEIADLRENQIDFRCVVYCLSI